MELRSVTHAIVSRNATHESVCGDSGIVIDRPRGALAIVADGLGHGEQARVASARVIAVAERNVDASLDALVRTLDRELASTRGAAVSVLRLELAARTMSFVGVGNVELRTRSAQRIHALTTPGIVGRGVPRARVWSFPIAAGDVLVLFTDGISSRMEVSSVAGEPTVLAAEILATYARGNDDAMVAALRIEGG